jgi:hypothetical protein
MKRIALAGAALFAFTVAVVAAPRPILTDPVSSSSSVGNAVPDTTAASLWAHLQAADYQKSWALWPGKGRLYEGTEPHGMLLTTYYDETASDAVERGALEDLPSGSILVKENYMPDGTLAAITVMVKRTGYNPDHQDWLFAKYDPRGEAEAFGRVAGCQACHSAAPSGAYIFTPLED